MATHHRALFISHGGGPLPLLGDPQHAQMVSCLQTIAKQISKPSAIITVSAHWESHSASVTSGSMPKLIYDYGGFPPESYTIQYPCPGSPTLAHDLTTKLKSAGITTTEDPNRGFDHGLFVPLKIMYPEADIPCVQLSLLSSLNPESHIRLGEALRDLNDPSILLIGSGFSFHNMRAFFTPETTELKAANNAFQQWLIATCTSRELSENERCDRLINWDKAPFSRYCHPREEHLLPLHVCYGFAGSACTQAFELEILNKETSMFLWD
ncbi:MAG: DODA-type extradiol aromatic ring-opening family dioxygenase [Plesiomonas shigelloides]